MPRPNFITNEDIERWSDNIDTDTNLPKVLVENPIIREVCYAGLWLAEELERLSCPDSMIIRIQFSAGKKSFGRDAWEIHQLFLEKYKNNQLDLEEDQNNLN